MIIARRVVIVVALLAFGACKSKRERALEVFEQAAALQRAEPLPAAAPAWRGEALPSTPVAMEALRAVEMPIVDPLSGMRTAGAWVVGGYDASSPEGHFDLYLVPDGGTPIALERDADTYPRLFRAGPDVYVGHEDRGGDGPGRLLRVVGERLESVELPLGYVARIGDRLFMATGWQLSATEFELYERGPRAAVPLNVGLGGHRAVGLVALDDLLVVAVQQRESMRGSVQERAAAMMEMLDGRPEAAAALGGSPGGFLLSVSPDGGRRREEDFPGQRPSALAIVDGGLVVIGEGTLARGQKDAVVVARARGETSGWRLLADALEMPDEVVQGGRWLCLKELTPAGNRVHCLAPALGRHLVTGVFEDHVVLWDIVTDAAGTRLVFKRNGSSRKDEPATIVSLALE